jgi:hypothetical protein
MLVWGDAFLQLMGPFFSTRKHRAPKGVQGSRTLETHKHPTPPE